MLPGLMLAIFQVHLLDFGQTGVTLLDSLLQIRCHAWPVKLQGCSGRGCLSAEVSGRGVHVRELVDLVAESVLVRDQDSLHLLVESRALSHHK